MDINLSDLFREVLGEEWINRASALMEEPEEKTKAGVKILIPAILGALVQKGNTLPGSSSILKYLEHADLLAQVKNPGNILQSEGSADLLASQGSAMVDFIFGKGSHVQGIVQDMVVETCGWSQTQAARLLKWTAPLLGGVLDGYLSNHPMDPTSLGAFLDKQIPYLKNEAESGFFERLGYSVLSTPKPQEDPPKDSSLSKNTVEIEEEDAEEETPEYNPPFHSRLIPWLILFAWAATLFFGMRQCGGKPRETATPSPTITQNDTAVNSTSSPEAHKDSTTFISSLIPQVIPLPNQQYLIATQGSAIVEIARKFRIKEKDASRIGPVIDLRFWPGSAEIHPQSLILLTQISQLLKAYPEVHMRIKCQGPDALTTRERMAEIQQWLIAQGIPSHRVSVYEGLMPGEIWNGENHYLLLQ